MTEETIFSKIIRREIPADIVYEDESVVAFKDIHPKAPQHILIIPRKIIPTANEATENDEKMLGHLITIAAQIAKQNGFADDGYRLMINCNKHGGQEVYHLHLHLLGGKPIGPMVCG
ncbi:MAG: HIT domain-containing protein [Chitinivibrionales bacterium]|nr:HIT domain-containing protein [Chitinivibrionales bacterium]